MGQGREAERAVGARLDSLAPLGFVTLYDRRFVGRGGNIDAVTVGPPGVFVVETKHRGRGMRSSTVGSTSATERRPTSCGR